MFGLRPEGSGFARKGRASPGRFGLRPEGSGFARKGRASPGRVGLRPEGALGFASRNACFVAAFSFQIPRRRKPTRTFRRGGVVDLGRLEPIRTFAARSAARSPGTARSIKPVQLHRLLPLEEHAIRTGRQALVVLGLERAQRDDGRLTGFDGPR